MKKLVFATNNAHKVLELEQILVNNSIDVLSLQDIGFSKDIRETAPDLEGNALIKARTIYSLFGVSCLADDTGLLVDELNGEPGVFSARYAGDHANANDNINLLLEKLGNTSNRSARFKTIFAFIHSGQEHLIKGEVEGDIAFERQGSSGFGYDPIFIPKGYQKSFAEMSASEKNAISHRGRAADGFLKLLKMISS